MSYIFDHYAKDHAIMMIAKHDEYKQDCEAVFDFFYSGKDSDSKIVDWLRDQRAVMLQAYSSNQNPFMSLNLAYHVMAEFKKNKEKGNKYVENKANMQDFIKNQLNDKMKAENEKAEALALAFGEDMSAPTVSERQRALKLLSNKKLLDFLKLFGRMLQSLRKAINEDTFKDIANITDVELGNDLKKLLGSERLALSNSRLGRYKKLQLLNKRLLQWKCTAKKNADRGGVQIWIDLSGSMMAGIADGDTTISRIDASIITAASMVAQLEKEKRPYKVFGFHTEIIPVFTSEVKLSVIDKLDILLKLSATGGTNFYQIFDSEEVLDDLKAGYDLCLLTDGINSCDLESSITYDMFHTGKSKLHLLKIGEKTPCAIDALATNILHAESMDDFFLYAQKVFI